MQGFNHTLTGVALALIIKQPLLIAPATLASHFLLDIIPHYGEHAPFSRGDRYYLPKITADGILSLVILAAAVWHWPHQALAILVGATFAILPDLFWPFGLKAKPGSLLARFLYFHKAIQWSETGPGIGVEVIWAFAAVLFLARGQLL
jgi:hypothetical protein